MKEHFVIQGGKKLKGEIKINGAKNSALKALTASILFKEKVSIRNVPQIEDIFRTVELLQHLGVRVKRTAKKTLSIDPSTITSTSIDKNIAECIRASVVIVGPLLAREKKVQFPHPGGCVIGKRPINLFLEGWKAMDAKIRRRVGSYTLTAPRGLKGCYFTFKKVSVTATETLMMTAVLARGKTTLRNTAREPEIPALADSLNKAGAHIRGAGSSTIHITGRGGKLLKQGSFTTIPDRIETGSFLILGALLGNPIKITDCNPNHIETPIELLKSAGVPITQGKDWVKVKRPRTIKSVSMETRTYPGFPTDLQAPFTVFMTQAQGESMIFETIFEGRLNYVENLKRMGAKITICAPHRVIVRGPAKLRGREIESPDIRAGLAFLIAALISKGKSKLNNIYHIDRGYENIEERLSKLGAKIARTKGQKNQRTKK